MTHTTKKIKSKKMWALRNFCREVWREFGIWNAYVYHSIERFGENIERGSIEEACVRGERRCAVKYIKASDKGDAREQETMMSSKSR